MSVISAAAKAARKAKIAKLRAEANAARFIEPDTSYRIDHTAPSKEGMNTPDNLSDVYPDDIYDPNVAGRYYGHGGGAKRMDDDSARLLSEMREQPNKEVEIYRAVPKGVTDINPGDWITINKDYAHSHGGSWVDDGNYDVISKKVKVKDIATDGNSIHEWGYKSIGAISVTSALMLSSGETQAQDDLSSSYLDARANSNLTPADKLLRSLKPVEPEDESFDLMASAKGIASTVGGIASDVVGGIIEAPRQIVGGISEGVQEALYAVDDLGSSIEDMLGMDDWETIIQFVDEKGNLDIEMITRAEAEKRGGVGDIMPELDDPRTVTGGLIKGISQFLVGFLPGVKAVKAMGVKGAVSSAMAGGAIADSVVFDPSDERLSDLIEEYPALSNPVTSYLEADPEDSKAEGRFKNALEGFALGGVADTFLKAVKTVRAKTIASKEAKAAKADIEKAEQLSKTKELKVDDTKEGDFIPFEEKAAKQEQEFKQAAGVADDEAAKNINLSRLETTDDVKSLIDNVAEADSTKINEARREAITLEETEKLADDLGMTVDDLLDRRRGQAFNAEQAVASRKILVASGEKLFDLADKAKGGGVEDLALFRRAMAQHQAIQQQVSGLTSEAGRALSSFRIMAKSAKEQERAIKEALEVGGGENVTRGLAEKMGDLKTTHQINQFVDGAAKATKPEMIYEAWINALLSSPATHVVNVVSNSVVSGLAVGERKIASLLGQARGSADSVAVGEATMQFKGMIEGYKDGMKMAWDVIKTGEPTDPLQKAEMTKFRSITAKNLNLTGTAGRAADLLGEIVRLPGRFLMAGDELFKTIGYRMELNAQAFRAASKEGLEGDELAERISSLITNPPENLHLEAIDTGRYQTFTKELGDAGKAIQSAREKVPGAKVIMPFIRTPINIMKYVGERTILAPLSQRVRAEIAAGGARKDMALAKIATGSTLMAIGADYTASGDITGKGPANWQQNRMLRETGWQPYSIKIGDTYYSYNRLDPIGAFLGLSADMSEILLHADEKDGFDVAYASIMATAQNVTSKTYLRGVAEFFDMMSSTSSEVGAEQTKVKNWIKRLAGTVIPSGVASLERVISPEMKATYSIIDHIKSRTPGLSEDLPPRRNVFGEKVVLQGGLGPDILSPVYTSEVKRDLVIEEIVAQGTPVPMPRKSIMGVELTPEQYDRYVVLASGKDNAEVDRKPIKQALREQFRSSLYKGLGSGVDGGKSQLILNKFSEYKQAAKAQMFKEFPELQTNAEQQSTEKQRKIMGK